MLYFYPKDNTPGCTTESIAFRELHDQFQQAGTEIYGISRDSLRSHEGFKSKLGLPFELISDPEEAVCTPVQRHEDEEYVRQASSRGRAQYVYH